MTDNVTDSTSENITDSVPENPTQDFPSPNSSDDLVADSSDYEDEESEFESNESEGIDWQQKYEQVLAEREKEQQDHLRFQADIENLKRRLQKDHYAHTQFVLESLFKDLLPSLDSFERAMDQDSVDSSEGVLEGVGLVYKQLMGVLEKHGLEQLECVSGSSFDPDVHQAIKIEHTSDIQGDEQVADVLQNGYMLHDRLLRPAMVYVLAPQDEDASDGPQS